jgi:hypothetical protein
VRNYDSNGATEVIGRVFQIFNQLHNPGRLRHSPGHRYQNFCKLVRVRGNDLSTMSRKPFSRRRFDPTNSNAGSLASYQKT